MKVNLGKDGKPKHAPFYVEFSIHDFGGNPDEYRNYLESLNQTYELELDRAEPGEPLRSWYAPDTQGDRQHSAALNRWSTKQGTIEAIKESQPKPTPDQMPRELAALHFGDEQDKKRSAEIIKYRSIAAEQMAKSEQYKALDGRDTTRVLDGRQRASQYAREVEKLGGTKYNFEEKQYGESVKWGEGELEKAMKMKPAEVEKNMDTIQALIQGYREMSDTEYSFALDENQVVKISHPDIPASELAARIGTTEDHHLLRILGGNGIERHEEPVPENKEEVAPVTEEPGMKEYNKYVEGQNAEAAAKAKDFAPTVRPGMFGG